MKPQTQTTEMTLHVKIPVGWYEGLRRLSDQVEGTIHQQARLAIRERLERKGLLARRQVETKTENTK